MSARHVLLLLAGAAAFVLYVTVVSMPRVKGAAAAVIAQSDRVQAGWRRERERRMSHARQRAGQRKEGPSSVEDELVSFSVRLTRAVQRASQAGQLLESHLRDSHTMAGGGAVRHPKLCWVVRERSLDNELLKMVIGKTLVSGNNDASFPPLLRTLTSLVKSSRQQGFKKILSSVYLAAFSGEESDRAILERYRTFALSAPVRVRRLMCSSQLEWAECAAERCFADGMDYVVVASREAAVMGRPQWAEELVRAFRDRDDLSAGQLGAGNATAFSRTHFRVFGPRMARWSPATAKAIVGEDFFFSLSQDALTMHGVSSKLAATEPDASEVGAARARWRRFLCRERQWTRFCDGEDTVFFSSLPSVHAGVGLTRAELEAVEKAEKDSFSQRRSDGSGAAAVLAAQTVAENATLARRRSRSRAKRAESRRLREVLSQYGGSVVGGEEKPASEAEVRFDVVAALHERERPKREWEELWTLSANELAERAERVLTKFAARNKLRVGLERMLHGRGVLSEDDQVMAREAREVLRNVSVVALEWLNGTLPAMVVSALEEKGNQTADGGGVVAAEEEAVLLLKAVEAVWPLAMRAQHPLAVERSVAQVRGECRIGGVRVPSPWFAWYVDDNMVSKKCYAEKSADELCCDYASPSPLCEASFASYDGNRMRRWINECAPGHPFRTLPERTFPCVVQGVLVPLPWHRTPETRTDVCVAPNEWRELCCDPLNGRAVCSANFRNYDAINVEYWKATCWSIHWKGAPHGRDPRLY